MKLPEYTVSDKLAAEVATVDTPFVLAHEGRAIIVKRSNGQSFYLTYRSRGQAQRGLNRVLPSLPNAELRRCTPGEAVVELARSGRESTMAALKDLPDIWPTLQPHEQQVIREELAALQAHARDLIAQIEEHFKP